MSVIGNQVDIGAGAGFVSPNRSHIHNQPQFLFTPSEPRLATEAFIYVREGKSVLKTVEIGVYRFSDFELVGKTTVEIPIDAPEGLYSASFPEAVELSSGVEYTVAFSRASPSDDGDDLSIRNTQEGSIQGSFNQTELPQVFPDSGSVDRSYVVYVTTEVAGSSTTPGLPATTILDKDGSPLTNTQVAVTVTAGATTLYDDTPTTDGSGLLSELDFSAHGSEPEVDDEVTWTITAGGITQSVTRTLVDLGD